MPRPPGQQTDVSPLEEYEYQLTMAELREDHWRHYFEILWRTGVRLSEALAIENAASEGSPGGPISWQPRDRQLRG